MDRYSQFGLRGDADEKLRRAVRDGFKAAGLTSAQVTQALEWYRDAGQHLGADPARLAESFGEFATAKGWQPEHLDAAVSVYDQIRDAGPDAVLATPTAEEDAATIARAAELLRTDPDAYWRDHELQEAQLEALERQQATPPPEPDRAAVADQIERQIAQRDVDKFAEMLRKEPAKYWASPELQRQHREAIAEATREAAQPVAQPAAAPSPSVPPAAAPAAPAPVKVAVSDAARRTEIEALMRTEGGKAYWGDSGIQREYGEVLARLAGEAPPLSPQAQDAPAAMSSAAEAPLAPAEP
jgi:hypothetical protein